MFSRPCQRLRVFPRLPAVHIFSRLPAVTCFPALSSRSARVSAYSLICMFSRAFQLLSIFPRLLPVTCFCFASSSDWFIVLFVAVYFSYNLLANTEYLSMYILGDRKRAIARVTAKRGSGNVTINDVPFTKYFGRMEDRYAFPSCPFFLYRCMTTQITQSRSFNFLLFLKSKT